MSRLHDDDELIRLLTKHTPVRSPKDAPLDARALAMRDRIVHSAPAPGQRAGRTPRLVWLTSAAAVVVALVVSAVLFWPTSSAVAIGPRPLSFTPAGDAGEIVEDALRLLSDGGGPAEPLRESRSAAWSLAVVDDGAQVDIVPELTAFTWNADGSGRVLVVAGEPYPSDAPVDGAEIVDSGEVLSDTQLAVGEFATPVAESPGSSREDLTAMLMALGMPEKNPSPGEVAQGINSVFDQWTLTDEQHATLLRLLADSGDVEALGTAVDRLGRQVYGLRVDSSVPGVSDTLLVSADSGRIVGIESQRVTAENGVPAGTIVAYRLWERPEGEAG